MVANEGLSKNTRYAIVAASFCLVALVGYVDGVSSAYIAFSISYVIPIFLATWFGDRTAGILIAAASATAGLAADIWTIHAAHVFAFTNVALRLGLFTLVALMFSRIKDSIIREKALVRREQAAAERLEEINRMKDKLMQSVVHDVREPLADIYARVVTMGFDAPTLTVPETRELLAEVADASRRLSSLVNKLLQEEQLEDGTQLTSVADPAS
jgi:signal transduction histidine kinase